MKMGYQTKTEVDQQTEMHGWGMQILDTETVAIYEFFIKHSVVVVEKSLAVPRRVTIVLTFRGRVVPNDWLPGSVDVTELQDVEL